MVARDIDVTVLCPVLETAAIFTALAPLAGHPRIRELRFRDDTGDWNVDPNYPDGVYWGPRYRSEAGTDWNLDVWFIHEDSRQFDLEHLESLPPKLTPEAREAILSIKECMSRAAVVQQLRDLHARCIEPTACGHASSTAPTWRALLPRRDLRDHAEARPPRGTSWNSGLRQPISSRARLVAGRDLDLAHRQRRAGRADRRRIPPAAPPPRAAGRDRSRPRRPAACSRRTCGPTPRTRRRTGTSARCTPRGRRPCRSAPRTGGTPPRPEVGEAARLGACTGCSMPGLCAVPRRCARLDKRPIFRQSARIGSRPWSVASSSDRSRSRRSSSSALRRGPRSDRSSSCSPRWR